MRPTVVQTTAQPSRVGQEPLAAVGDRHRKVRDHRLTLGLQLGNLGSYVAQELIHGFDILRAAN